MDVPKNDTDIAFVIFGVTGDLTHRKLLPALYEIVRARSSPGTLHTIGFARRDWDDAKLQDFIRECVSESARHKPVDLEALEELAASALYICSTFDDTGGYRRLAQLLDGLGLKNRLYYLATPPGAYTTIVQHLGKAGLANCPGGWTRIVVEKPYGRDLESARELDREVHEVFKEEQVYRIDHYLGKETVQNLLAFRFANAIFEPLWNRRYIDHVQIAVAETVGVGSRAEYYEKSGVLRDMFQNHLLQLVTLTAMEAPAIFDADTIRDEKLKVLHSLRPLEGDAVQKAFFRAQYSAGKVDGEPVPGYRQEEGVAPGSTTETLLAVTLHIDNWRWADVPFCVRSGKRLDRRVSEIAIQFKQVPLPLFGMRNLAGQAPNRLLINIQPEEGITLTFGAKAPGPMDQIKPVEMHFDYVKTFGGEPPEAYERLLLDALTGDATLFTRSDEVEAAWSFTTKILRAWEKAPVSELPAYPAGSWGPPEIDKFIQESIGREWKPM